MDSLCVTNASTAEYICDNRKNDLPSRAKKTHTVPNTVVVAVMKKDADF